MATAVRFTDDPGDVLDTAGGFLASRPTLHNLILTLLHERIARPQPGRYWIASDADRVVGVVFQSPTEYPAALTPLPGHAVDEVVAAIAGSGAELPGVAGEAATAARFAACWTEHRGSAARPVEGQRIYEVDAVVPPTGVAGRLRPADPEDRDLLVDWLHGFDRDVGGIGVGDPAAVVDQRLPAGHFWIWDDGGPVSMAARSTPLCRVTRIQAVYTPAGQRGYGYASASVAALSARMLDAGERCMLYADLANPTSNRIYRRIGYRAIAETLRYAFAG